MICKNYYKYVAGKDFGDRQYYIDLFLVLQLTGTATGLQAFGGSFIVSIYFFILLIGGLHCRHVDGKNKRKFAQMVYIKM